jgi:hypothetical protein
MDNKKEKKPLPNGTNGERDELGRFTQGNKGGPGNPHARKTARLRSALLSAIEPDDMIAIIKILIAKAKRGNILATKEVFDRAIGKPQEADLFEKLENLERTINEFERES